MKKKLFINTMGCQMNVYDTEQIEKILGDIGYERTDTLASADLIIANTCTIREKAEQKAFSFLGRTAQLKKKKPHLIVGIGGCVAQQEGDNILKRVPHIDLIFGTDAICRLPDLIETVEKQKGRIIDVEMNNGLNEINEMSSCQKNDDTAKFVTIMRGCDNYCTYCVVPFVRGRERSRPPENILKEAEMLGASGVRDITLLGQNVNSYGKKEGLCSFADLIKRINEIEDIYRIRFTTSHPKDLSADLVDAFGTVDKLCNHIHLPVQSGSNDVLKRMNRKYTREQYFEKVDRLRHICPDIAVTSDIIVGFPGESKTDYRQTLDLIKTIEYDSLFVFNYSDRPNAPAAAFPQKVSTDEKNMRLREILDIQNRITAYKNSRLTGETVEVLVEGMSKKSRAGIDKERENRVQWSGRTSSNKIVNFIVSDDAKHIEEDLLGKLVQVKIEKALAHSLWGRMKSSEPHE